MKVTSVIIFILLPVLCSAQLSLGITAGSNIGKFGGVEPRDAEYTLRAGLNVGVTFAYRLNKDISLTFQPMYSHGIIYFISGLEFGIPLSAELVHAENSRDISGILNNVDILASIGMGLRFSIGKPDLMIEFRYYQGLVNFNSGSEEEEGNIILDNFKNSGFQLMAGIEWEL
jgi:hypothetical protein